MVKKESSLDDAIKKALADAPTIEGYTIKQLAERIDTPWPTTRWHLELLEAKGTVEYVEIGKAKVYKLIMEESEKK